MGGLNEKVGFFKSGNTTLPVSSSTSIFQVSRNLTLPVSSSTSMIPLLSLHTPRPSLFLTHFPPHLSTPLPRFKSPPPQTHHPCFPISTLPAKTKTPVLRSQDDRETWGFLKVMFEEDGTARTRMLAHLGFSIPVEEKDAVPEDNLTQEINSIRLNDTPADEMGYENNQEATIFSADDGEDFFNNLPSPKADTSLVPSGDNVGLEKSAPKRQDFLDFVVEFRKRQHRAVQISLEYGAKKGDGLRFFPPADRQTQEMHFQTMMQDIAASLLMEFEKYVFQAEYSGTISQDTFGFAS
uniref:Uncharacterized protein n=1 Tax=Salix viminalis TaxID=40686 RepID=A0A6N2KMH3_SALVM